MAVQRRGAAKDQSEQLISQQDDNAPPREASGASGATAAAPPAFAAVQPRVAINIAVHSLLMLVLPLSLFFASYSGLLDPVYARTFGIPSSENKTTVGAVLAVLGVNAVIASFVVVAFNEPDPPLEAKED